MSTNQLRLRIAALRAEACAVGAELGARGAGMGQEELFEVTGELQAVANAVEGAQLVAIAHAGSHELRLTERGPVEIHHEVGFIGWSGWTRPGSPPSPARSPPASPPTRSPPPPPRTKETGPCRSAPARTAPPTGGPAYPPDARPPPGPRSATSPTGTPRRT